ncbi:TonB-dependent receptor [Sediminitomix flava]|uniref:Outer membrane receptor for Fe3+-dicitrate n=1 Tax=Sediminitomix flava TaxID=379075 RepID=A0A315Z2I4_SEDFL|nr:TonB-dependent receptor [Sediminitomix flava]PWJ35996.1 outer membrane receptor for Fe3+-dicitrate [Sediminitomix flava]
MKSLNLIILFVFTSIISFAQELVKGTITDQSNNPLVGVTIINSATEKGTTTDIDGVFSLEVEKGNELQISSVGFIAQKIIFNGKELTITLEEDRRELNTVVVSASRDAQLRKDIPVAISTVSAQLLDETKASSLDQVLSKTPGVLMVDLGSEQHMMAVRQPISTKSLFLYLEDGLPVRPNGIFNHNALIEMNMAMLDRVEVIRGPASSMYGSEAIGGAMNFISQRPTSDFEGAFSVRGDNQGYLRTDGRVSGKTKDGKLGYSLGTYYAERNDGFLDHSDFHKLAVSLALDYQISEQTVLETNTTYIDYRSDMGSSVDSTNFYERNYESSHTFTERVLDVFRTSATLKHTWSESSNTFAKAFYRSNTLGQIPSYRVKNNWSDLTVATGEINESAFESYGAIVQHNQKLAFLNSTLRAGLSLDYSPTTFWANQIDVTRDESGRYIDYSENGIELTNYDVKLTNKAAYLQYEMNPVKNLQIVAGLRYDHFTYDYKNNLSAEAFSGAPDSKDTFEAFTPKLGLTYDFGKGIGAYANYSVGFVPPQVSELYRGVKVPVLDPATYSNYEVGAWYELPNNLGYFEMALYQMIGEDEIVSVIDTEGNAVNQNAGETLHQGIEYSLKIFPVRDLELRFGGTSATHVYEEFVEKGTDFSGNDMSYAPKFISNSEITYRPSQLKGARIALEWQHVSPYFMDQANTVSYSGYDLLNLRLGYAYKGFDLWLNMMNLGDTMYATRASRTSWGYAYNVGAPRTFQVGLGYSF